MIIVTRCLLECDHGWVPAYQDLTVCQLVSVFIFRASVCKLSFSIPGKQVECPWVQTEVREAGGGAGGGIQCSGGQTLMWAMFRIIYVSLKGLLADVEVYSGSGQCSNLKIAPLPSPRYTLLLTSMLFTRYQELFTLMFSSAKSVLPWYHSHSPDKFRGYCDALG